MNAKPPECALVTGAARRIAPTSIVRPVPMSDTDFTGRSRWVYQELRDRKVALFVDKLPEIARNLDSALANRGTADVVPGLKLIKL